jgi:magnesium transporter
MISYYYRSVREEQLKKSEKFRVGSWIVVEEPSREELEELGVKFGLDTDLLTDALDPDEIPRSEAEDGIVYVYMRYAYRRGEAVDTDPVLLAIGPKFVAVVARRPLPNMERLLASRELVTTQRVKLLVLLLRQFIQTYESNLRLLDRRIRNVRAKLTVESISNRDFIEFVTIEDTLNSFLSDLVPAHLVLQTLMSGRFSLTFYEEDTDLVEDLVQTTRQLNESSRASLRTIVNIREAYATIMANNLNRIFKLLTSITIIMTIPTIVTSIYSMNVAVPLQHNKSVFWVITAVILATMGVAAWIFKRNKWF